jgi:hypothetical protein
MAKHETVLIPQLKPNNRLDIVGYEHAYLDPTSFVADIKQKFPHVVFIHEPKKARFVHQPFIIVPRDEYTQFIRKYRQTIQLPHRWSVQFTYIVTRHFGKEICDLFMELDVPFTPNPNIKPTITRPQSPQYRCWFSYRGDPETHYNYTTRRDIPRLMLELKRDKQKIGESMATVPILAIREIQQLVLSYL